MDLFAAQLIAAIEPMIAEIDSMELDSKIEVINTIKRKLHAVSPFKDEPVDCVVWVKGDKVTANDYNPNSVAPPEMKLLERSIGEDGYTQPIVSWARDGVFEVVDGFHRNRVGKESAAIRKRVHGYLPLTVINGTREDLGDRMASTIRHNRARGKHKVESMSDIVIELKRRNWTDERICRDLGMDQDEVLRLCQITGLAEMFSNQEFSASWDVEGEVSEDDFEELTDDVSTYGEETKEFRTVNTSDEGRVFHTYEKWECYAAGFYKTTHDGMTEAECKRLYYDMLSDPEQFGRVLGHIITEWKHSCEHYLTNSAMNRIAWLGQAAACYELGIPSTFRGGFNLLSPEQQDVANGVALEYLNKWLVANGRPAVTMAEAYTGRQSDIY